ncbi:CLUMA_CG015503, isoform A [Clunio marinus]|uniref:CLUMA_CG015503, isoform A n=1 Tax=Clunio marinus TaxID=568069 RepID=A0A1J1IPP7_9DIPT|nr:CLUMA_CG015503, isoform A [Clunio marinus]
MLLTVIEINWEIFQHKRALSICRVLITSTACLINHHNQEFLNISVNCYSQQQKAKSHVLDSNLRLVLLFNFQQHALCCIYINISEVK